METLNLLVGAAFVSLVAGLVFLFSEVISTITRLGSTAETTACQRIRIRTAPTERTMGGAYPGNMAAATNERDDLKWNFRCPASGSISCNDGCGS